MSVCRYGRWDYRCFFFGDDCAIAERGGVGLGQPKAFRVTHHDTPSAAPQLLIEVGPDHDAACDCTLLPLGRLSLCWDRRSGPHLNRPHRARLALLLLLLGCQEAECPDSGPAAYAPRLAVRGGRCCARSPLSLGAWRLRQHLRTGRCARRTAEFGWS